MAKKKTEIPEGIKKGYNNHPFFIHNIKDGNKYTTTLLHNVASLLISSASSGMSMINIMTIIISVLARSVDDEEKLMAMMGSIAEELNMQMLLISRPISDSVM